MGWNKPFHKIRHGRRLRLLLRLRILAKHNPENIIEGIKTGTANIKSFQQLSRRHKSNDKDIAAALAIRNLLRHTKTTQISSNKKFASVKFHPKEHMELFCSEPLQINNHHIRFRPDTKFRKTRHYTLLNISFFNVPTEAPDDALTEFLQQLADAVGEPFYPQQQFQGIYCNTVTRVYQVQKLYQHILRNIRNMFGRTIKCIYDKQDEQVDSDRIIPFTEHDNNHHGKPTDCETEPENETTQENQKQQPTTNEKQQSSNKTVETHNQNKNTPKTSNKQKYAQINGQNITTRKIMRKTQQPQYSIENPSPTMNSENYPILKPTINKNTGNKTEKSNNPSTNLVV